ncbi:hypothetical protein H0H87_001069 [Tephrocybe sp. NHM501043]|nr:hypothetical protein H0H87_001069 [Tephrocybe sp. NHM501043]
MRNLPEQQDAVFRDALDYNPREPSVDKKSSCPKLTHPLAIYDTHLDRRLSLKRVKLVSSFLTNLSQSVDIALKKASEDDIGLPFVNADFPTPRKFRGLVRNAPAKDAKDIADRYRLAISPFACYLASMLSLHPTADSWATAVHMSIRIVSRYQKFYPLIEDYVPEILDSYEPIPGKQYAMVDKDAWSAMNEDERKLLEEMRNKFPKMALWEFFFACPESEDILRNMDRLVAKENFPEIVPLTHVDHWKPTDTPLPPSPDAITTAWETTVLSWVGETPVVNAGHGTPTTTAIPEDHPVRRNTRSSVAQKPAKKGAKGVKREKSSKASLPTSSAIEEHQWHNVTIPECQRDLSTIDEDITVSLVQHAWSRAVERDSSFIVFHCGKFERIAFRHRGSQTLFISDLIDVAQCKDPAYAHIQIGLFISIIDDIRDRTRQLLSQEAEVKPVKRKRRNQPFESDKRPKTRRSTALEEARKLEYTRNFKAVCNGLIGRNLALLCIQHGPFNSSVPSSLLRITSETKGTPKPNYEPHEYFRMTITSEIAFGTTGDAHTAMIDLLESDGKIISYPDVVVKLAFTSVQKRRLRHEFDVYTHLMGAGAQGIPHMFGLFEDVETEVLVLVMENAGSSLWSSRLADKSQRLKLTISESEKAGFMDALKSIHKAGVRHRDLRVENLTINRNGDPYIIDFDRSALEADEKSRELELEKLQALLDGRREFRLSRETPESEVKADEAEEWE